MDKRLAALLPAALILTAGCASFYKSRPQMTYYRGQNVPEGFIRVVDSSPEEITFRIQVAFARGSLYHILLEGNRPVAEGWFPTQRAGGQFYEVTMKPAAGATFGRGKVYRLCIGDQSPEAVQLTSSNYRCLADFEFTMK